MTKNDLPTVDIKGKEYVMVKDRIAYFNEEYPQGCIQTEMTSYRDGQVIFKATVYPDVAADNQSNTSRCFTGWSQAREDQGMINKTSALENAETSAVGRALAMMGIGVIESIASADEMVKAIAPQRTETIAEELDRKTAPRTLTAAEREMEESIEESTAEDMCPLHGVKMFLKEGKYGEFYSHGRKLEDGTWDNCVNGKGYKSELK
jgi:hypothetical protein